MKKFWGKCGKLTKIMILSSTALLLGIGVAGYFQNYLIIEILIAIMVIAMIGYIVGISLDYDETKNHNSVKKDFTQPQPPLTSGPPPYGVPAGRWPPPTSDSDQEAAPLPK